MKRWLVKVLSDNCSDERVWSVKASTRDDATQLAFALDGGWCHDERDATEILELTKQYCTAKEVPMAQPGPGQNGIDLIAEERLRQVSHEGWSAKHDDGHTLSELALAARAYVGHAIYGANDVAPPQGWPWDAEDWKPCEDPVRNLVKAGALIAAEIDRLQRLKMRKEMAKDPKNHTG